MTVLDDLIPRLLLPNAGQLETGEPALPAPAPAGTEPALAPVRSRTPPVPAPGEPSVVPIPPVYPGMGPITPREAVPGGEPPADRSAWYDQEAARLKGAP